MAGVQLGRDTGALQDVTQQADQAAGVQGLAAQMPPAIQATEHCATGNAGGTHNLILSSTKTVSGGLDALLKTMGTGLLVTEMMGQGVNGVNGDYSRGAFGYWVENGIIVHPVEEITIAGNLKDMLANIVAVGDDSYWRGSKYVGSILIESMTVAGN